MFRALLVVVGLLLVVSSPSAAQTARPGVDCSLLTVSQAQGLPCATPPRPDPVAAPPDADPALNACTPMPNPYLEPDRATLCNLLLRPRLAEPVVFALGGIYRHAYASQVLVVTELRMEADGRTTVTGRWVRHSDVERVGKVYVFTSGTEPFARVEP